MESQFHLPQVPPPLQDPGEPILEPEEGEEDDVFVSPEDADDLPLGSAEEDAVSVSEVLNELGNMTRPDGSLKYTGSELKELGKRLEKQLIDLTLIEPNAMPYTYKTHKLDMQAIKPKTKVSSKPCLVC